MKKVFKLAPKVYVEHEIISSLIYQHYELPVKDSRHLSREQVAGNTRGTLK